MGRGPAVLIGAVATFVGVTSVLFGADMLDGTFGDIIPIEDVHGDKAIVDLSVDGEIPVDARMVSVGMTAGGGILAVAGGSLVGRALSK